MYKVCSSCMGQTYSVGTLRTMCWLQLWFWHVTGIDGKYDPSYPILLNGFLPYHFQVVWTLIYEVRCVCVDLCGMVWVLFGKEWNKFLVVFQFISHKLLFVLERVEILGQSMALSAAGLAIAFLPYCAVLSSIWLLKSGRDRRKASSSVMMMIKCNLSKK